MDDLIQIAEQICDQRIRSGLSQSQVAKELGINRVTYTTIESAKRPITVLELMKLTRFLNVDIRWILGIPTKALKDK